MAAALVITPAPRVHADAARASMRVTVTVPRHVALVATEALACEVTPQQGAARVVVARARYRLRSTSSTGIALVVTPAAVSGPVTVAVLDLTGQLTLPPTGGTVALPAYPPGETSLEATFELKTADPDACTAFPVTVSVTPL